MFDAYNAHCKIVFDEANRPIDFIYLELKSTFETLTGQAKEKELDKKVIGVLRGIRKSNPELFDMVISAHSTEESLQDSIFIEPLDAWFAISICPLENGYFMALFDNITEYKNTERKLKEERDYLEKLHNSLGDAIFCVKLPERVIEFANNAIQTVFEYSPEECIGQTTRMFYPKEGFEIFKRKLDAAMSHGENLIRTEQDLVKKNGKIFPAEITTTFFKEGDEFVKVISIVRDITSRKDAESEMSKLQMVIENSINVILITDKNAVVEYVNPSFTEMTGYSKEEVLGKTPSMLTSGETSVETYKVLWDTILSGNTWRGTFLNTKKNGESYVANTVITPVKDGQGTITHFLGVQEDVTEKQKLELALLKSQKLESLGILAGGIAHDFNNILTPILGNAELLMDDLDIGVEALEGINSILKSTHRAKELVSQILLFSRQSETEKRIEDVSLLIPELLEFTRSTLPATITLSGEVAVQSAPVFCDSSHIYQVLVNLCINAAQAITGIGKINISLEITTLNDFRCMVGGVHSGEYVRITVSDNGVGMDDETLEHVFEPFYTTKAVGEGAGLGLSIVFGIVKDHNGGIAITSELGSGTIFEILLPLAEEPAQQLSDPEKKIQYRGSEHILLVDDEDSITSLGKRALEQLGYQVTVASDGQAALGIFSENPDLFDMLVTDQTMPRMTGDLLAYEVLKIKPSMPVMLCSGHHTEVSPENSKILGVSRIMHKPYGSKELGQAVREVLDEAKEVEHSSCSSSAN